MATTARPRPRTGAQARASARASSPEESREKQFDLLTAALIGVALGVGTTILFRRGPEGDRPILPILKGMGRGAKWAGVAGLRGAKVGAKASAKYGKRGAEWVADRGEELWDRVPAEEIGDSIGEFLEEARDRIADTVESEISDLRKAIKRQRRKLGV